MTVVEAVTRDLAVLAVKDIRLAESSLAATALVLAGELDDPGNSATSKSMCAARLNETMAALLALAPEDASSDGVDGLQERARLKLAK